LSKSGARSSAFAVSAGILLSRLIGLVRERVFAYYFGNSDAADAFRSAFKIPNFLQNLFGEGVLSASFIPVYARLRAEERHEEATRLAESIFAILFFITSLLTLVGVFATPLFIDAIAPGFHGEKRELTMRLVQILFPGAALLVMSAWCLGILNSHRKFFLSYAAPVIWNVAQITALLWKGGHVTDCNPRSQRKAFLAIAGAAVKCIWRKRFQKACVLPLVCPWHSSWARHRSCSWCTLRFPNGTCSIRRGPLKKSCI